MRRMVYIQYTNPAGYPPLEHSSRILAKEGWEVLFLGTDDFTGNALQLSPHPQIEIKRLPYCPPGWIQKLHYLWFCAWSTSWVLWRRTRWIYCSDPFSSPVGWLLSLVPSFRLIYHEHDHPPKENNSVFFQKILGLRGKLAARAKLCILPNEERARRFASEIGAAQKVYCVYNCPSQEEICPPRSPAAGDTVWVLYHGSLVPSRLPLAVLEALRMLPEGVKLRVIGYETMGHRGYLRQLQEEARRRKVAHRVEFIGTLPTRDNLLEYCRNSDVGLALIPTESEDYNDHTMAGASNKPFDYLASGMALLVSDLPDWKKMFVEPGLGLPCDPGNPHSIAEILRWFLEHPDQMRAMGEKGRQRILADWNYEAQFLPVLKELNEDLGRGIG